MTDAAIQQKVEKDVPEGHVRVEIISGPEGPSLSFSHNNRGGTRVAGPKPWGGGKVTGVFDVRRERFADMVTGAEEASTDAPGPNAAPTTERGDIIKGLRAAFFHESDSHIEDDVAEAYRVLDESRFGRAKPELGDDENSSADRGPT